MDIHICPWSDHHIVSCNLSWIGLPSATRTWRLNDSLLTDRTIVSQLSERLTEYFSQNYIDEISAATLRVAHMAMMRGHLIEIATTRKRQRYSLTYIGSWETLSQTQSNSFSEIAESNLQRAKCPWHLALREHWEIPPLVKSQIPIAQQFAFGYVCQKVKTIHPTYAFIQIKRWQWHHSSHRHFNYLIFLLPNPSVSPSTPALPHPSSLVTCPLATSTHGRTATNS